VTTPTRIDLAEKLATFSEPWQPRVVGRFNGHDLMVARLKGEFTWHKHDDTDDFFLVLKGSVTIRMHEGDVTLGPGQLYVVPRGVEHCPVAEEGAEGFAGEADAAAAGHDDGEDGNLRLRARGHFWGSLLARRSSTPSGVGG